MSFSQILNEVNSEGRRRINAKVPEWLGVEGLIIPNRLCAEQCSSSRAARIKAQAAGRLTHPLKPLVADLTGGIGVDSWAFADIAAKVLHNEMDPDLSRAAALNFTQLGCGNVICTQMEILPDNVEDVLDDFFEDSPIDNCVCYLDPARRSRTGDKVFRIRDCSPNILELLPIVLGRCRYALVKLSPMADIDLCIKELNAACGKRCCLECACIGVDGECKELLLTLDSCYDGEPRISVIDGSFRLSFTRSEEAAAVPLYPTVLDPAADCSGRGLSLFEPGSALAKSGAFRILSERYHLTKAGRSTQLYWCREMPPAELCDAGKWFRIKEIVPFCNEQIRRYSGLYPRCELSARNIPITSDELRKKMKALSGGEHHIFAFTADFPDGHRRLLASTERISITNSINV